MSEASEKKLATIRGLLAKAEDPAATKPEAEAFMAKATELMAKYGVDRALLAASDPTSDAIGDKRITVPGPYAMAKALLLYSIAEALGVKGARIQRRKGKATGDQVLVLVGMESDLERVELIYTSLLVQALRFQTWDYSRDPLAWAQPKKWKRDYMDGFRTTVVPRIEQAEARARQEAQEAPQGSGPSVALVLVTKAELVSRAYEEKFPNARASSSSRPVGAGYGVGMDAGNRADIGGTRIATGRKAIS
ncbi:DUF2786 domain-containing protein [Micromonospora sp. WMMD961]|uniref:DUF2786 domain-containing protein n=1 Tax=Micromonospora sp. WMMD961 TaxID=3016100 RepID=UPI002417DE6B|nr:DUF2786 domain-containing protein [Micromonospora sp. WMMD961]MDG4783276.1 DUF2786 domain-containing protein [Micromonospora sp. WMMD961]